MKPFYAKDVRLELPEPENLNAFHDALQDLLHAGECLDPRFGRYVDRRLGEQRLRKRCIVLERDEQPTRVYFIAKGCAIYFIYVLVDGLWVKTAQYILRAGDFILPPGTFADWPSPVRIELSTDATLLSLDLKHYAKALRRFPQGAELTNRWRDRLEKRRLRDRAEIAVRNNAFEQLLWLMEKWPDCFRTLSDQVIGDYLGGMARETVARHKRQVMDAYAKKRKPKKM